jgi:hypothetical protein
MFGANEALMRRPQSIGGIGDWERKEKSGKIKMSHFWTLYVWQIMVPTLHET